MNPRMIRNCLVKVMIGKSHGISMGLEDLPTFTIDLCHSCRQKNPVPWSIWESHLIFVGTSISNMFFWKTSYGFLFVEGFFFGPPKPPQRKKDASTQQRLLFCEFGVWCPAMSWRTGPEDWQIFRGSKYLKSGGMYEKTLFHLPKIHEIRRVQRSTWQIKVRSAEYLSVESWQTGDLTLPETNSSHLKIGHPKRKGSYFNHPFVGAFAVSFRECNRFKQLATSQIDSENPIQLSRDQRQPRGGSVLLQGLYTQLCGAY